MGKDREAGEEMMEWISVEDRLPKEDEQVLCIDTSEGFAIGKYTITYQESIDWIMEPYQLHSVDNSLYRVTHWMPLPPKPSLEIEHPPKKWCC